MRYYADESNRTDMDYETDNRVSFKDLKNDVKFFLPLDIAFMESERDSAFKEHIIKVRKRLIRKNGK